MRLSSPRPRVRRGSVASPRHAYFNVESIVVAAVPPRRVIGRSKRAACQMPRPRKLSPEQEAAIRRHNALVYADAAFDACVVPTRDGVLVARRR